MSLFVIGLSRLLLAKKMGRLSYSHLAEHCVTLLYSVWCNIIKAGVGTALDEPVEQL